MRKKRDWQVFINSIFFVLGFSVIFSLLGVLLQGVLSDVSTQVTAWLGRIGGVVIITFGLYLVGLIKIRFLEAEHKIRIKKRFRSSYITSFVFGAAFAVGWTPCVGAILGAILALAITQPSIAFFLMLSYSLGLGIPFIITGLFVNQAQVFIKKSGKWIKYFTYFFGVILIILGILVFTNELSRVANLALASNILISLNIGSTINFSTISLGIAFLAGLASFLSPCVLPLIPAFLSYLASLTVKK